MKTPKPGQLATLIDKNMGVGCIIRVTRLKSVGTPICEECKKSNCGVLCSYPFCLMLFFAKSCAQTIPAENLYPKIVKFFKV